MSSSEGPFCPRKEVILIGLVAVQRKLCIPKMNSLGLAARQLKVCIPHVNSLALVAAQQKV